MSGFRRAMLLTGLLALGGCAWLPDEDTPRARLMALNQLVPTPDNGQPSRWPRSSWWRDFRDPALNRLVETAIAGSPDLKVAAHRLREAQALGDMRAAALLPQVAAGMSVDAMHYSMNSVQLKLAGDTFALAMINPVILQYHVDLWGRDRAALEEALGLVQAEEAENLQARLLLSTALSRAYFRLRLASEQRDLAIAMTATLRERLRLLHVRLEHGLATRQSLETEEARLQEAEQRLQANTLHIRLLRDQLAAMAGQGPAFGDSIRWEADPLAELPPTPAVLPLHLLARRPDIIAARCRAEAAAKAIEVAEKAFYPDVNIRGFAGLHSVNLIDALFHSSSLAFAVGPTLELPIFEGGRLEANLAAREAGYDSAVETYNAGLVSAVRQTADALAHLDEATQRTQSQRQAVAALETNRQLADVLAQQGLQDRTLQLEQRYVRDLQVFRLKTCQGDKYAALIDLIEALGGGLSPAAAKT